ncbi:phosphoribosyltransferase [Noviherbaspirillum cavernae]|uniref:Phosphoribosyltransferase n=1 Tax=Noviherbaspirillum cavernae TaxID=2320862 RepID=A0A418X082_9BURK|nr:phosphoribosyltransferase family protein [Noviherbaspirillum cavernae]RJG05899.1 phosphoribosyltransferase [Noviherbaspirillum cavernae]
MPVSDDKHLWVSWAQYHRSIEELVKLVHESGWKFNQVLCLARGGLRPGDIFSRIFDVPLAILSTNSYRAEAGTVQGELGIAKHITVTKGTVSGKVLLVDDLADSGVTLKRVQEHLQFNFPGVTEVKSAVIWCKACSVLRPDYYLEFLPTNPWIHQPFEEYDSMRPADVIARLKSEQEV